jgi:hypothetical protein
MEIINSTDFLVNKKKTLDLEEWSRLVTEWKKSSESQKDFCARLNLNINTFTYVKAPIQIRSATPLLSHDLLNTSNGVL